MVRGYKTFPTTWPNADGHSEKKTQTTKHVPEDISTWIHPCGAIKDEETA